MSINRLQHDIGALEASVVRAGVALACCYSTADEFEAEVIRVRRNEGAFGSRRVAQMRFVLGATVVTSLAALLVLVL